MHSTEPITLQERIARDIDDRFGYGCLECNGFGIEDARAIVARCFAALAESSIATGTLASVGYMECGT